MKNKALPPPSYVAIDLTYRCGLDCSFCFVKRHSLEAGRELGLAGWIRLIKDLGPGRKKFYLTGGEPLLAAFLPELVKKIRSMGHSSLVTTSLAAPYAKAAALAKAGPDEIVVSVHGAPSLHEDLARKPGVWRTIERNLETVKKLRPQGTGITLWCTINPSNHSRLHKVYRSLRRLGADRIAFNHLEFTSAADLSATRELLAGIGASTPLKASAPRGIDAAALEGEIKKIKSEAGAGVSFYPDLRGPELRAWYSPRSAFKKKGYCRGQFAAAWFSPSGELLTCQPLAVNLGAPGSGGFRKLYNAAAYSAFRKLILKNGGFLPACRRCGREPYAPAAAGI